MNPNSINDEIRSLLEKDPPPGFVGFEEPKVEQPTPETTEVSNQEKQPSQTDGEPAPIVEITETKENKSIDTPEEPQMQGGEDFVKKLEEISGGKIKSLEEVAEILKEKSELEEKLQKGTYKTELARKLDEWVDAGLEPELFHAIQGLPIDNLSEVEAIKAHMKISNPELSEEEIELLFDNEYKQSDNYTEYEARIGKIKMRGDYQKAINELSELQSMTVVENAKAKREQELANSQMLEQERQTTWNSNVPKLVSELQEFKYELSTGEEAKYVPSKEQLAKVEEVIKNAVINAKIPYNEQTINTVRELIKKEFVWQYSKDIIKAASTTAASKATEKLAKDIHNPSALRGENIKPKDTTQEDIAFKEFANRLGVRI